MPPLLLDWIKRHLRVGPPSTSSSGDKERKDARILEKIVRILWRDCQEEVPHT
jgi:hypothetical protein